MKFVVGFVLGCFVLLCPLQVAFGQAAPAADPPIDDAIKQQTDVTASADQITQSITTETQKLSTDSDAVSQAMSRDWLIAQPLSPGATDAFKEFYYTAINKQLAAILAQPNVSVRTRVNVAIVAAKIAESSKTWDLLPVTLTLLNDPSDAIVLWGERAAGFQLVDMLNDPNAPAADRKTLLDTMESAVVKHCGTPTLGGFIVEQVYSDINPFLKGVNPQGAALDDLINTNLALQKGRLGLYTSGNMPESPYVDTYASQFLLDPGTWAAMNPQQQLAAVQQAGDLICKAALLEMSGNVNNGAPQQSDLMKAVSREGDYLGILATKLNNTNLAGAATAVKDLGVASQPTAIRQACQQAADALSQAFPGFVPVPDFAHAAAGAAGQ
jgi:hypothetical protein